MRRWHPFLVLSLLASLLLPPASAHSPAEAIAEMTTAANAWVTSLSPEQRTQAVLRFAAEERENWHYVPRSRDGVPLAQMNEKQRQLARALLASGLSQHGLLQAEAVIALERVLRVIEGADYRDEMLYFFTVFGQPGTAAPWGWRVEGHHLSVNFTIAGGRVSATPNFVGANPAEVRSGPQAGQRLLVAEEDEGRAFVLSLDNAQRTEAIISATAPGDIITRATRIARPLEPAGIGFTALKPVQQEKLKALVALYASRLRPEVAKAELSKITDSGWEMLSFAWAGGLKRGEGHYYRIQGPAFVIEYDNTQNRANHIHTVWRVFEGDFGRDLLQEHYRESHKR